MLRLFLARATPLPPCAPDQRICAETYNLLLVLCARLRLVHIHVGQPLVLALRSNACRAPACQVSARLLPVCSTPLCWHVRICHLHVWFWVGCCTAKPELGLGPARACLPAWCHLARAGRRQTIRAAVQDGGHSGAVRLPRRGGQPRVRQGAPRAPAAWRRRLPGRATGARMHSMLSAARRAARTCASRAPVGACAACVVLLLRAPAAAVTSVQGLWCLPSISPVPAMLARLPAAHVWPASSLCVQTHEGHAFA